MEWPCRPDKIKPDIGWLKALQFATQVHVSQSVAASNKVVAEFAFV